VTTFQIADRRLAGDVQVIELEGEGDMLAAPELRAHFDAAIARGATRLILDLSDATFVDSTVLGILVGALKRLRPRGARLAVVCPDPRIRKLFEITGLDRMLPVAETVAEALGALKDPGSSDH
jgi:anti-sigma B factor antagonist